MSARVFVSWPYIRPCSGFSGYGSVPTSHHTSPSYRGCKLSTRRHVVISAASVRILVVPHGSALRGRPLIFFAIAFLILRFDDFGVEPIPFPAEGAEVSGAGFSGIPKHTLLSAGADKIRRMADLLARDRQSRFRESGSRFDPCNVRQIIGAGQGFRSGHRRPATASTKNLSGFPFSSRAWHGCHNCQSWYAWQCGHGIHGCHGINGVRDSEGVYAGYGMGGIDAMDGSNSTSGINGVSGMDGIIRISAVSGTDGCDTIDGMSGMDCTAGERNGILLTDHNLWNGNLFYLSLQSERR